LLHQACACVAGLFRCQPARRYWHQDRIAMRLAARHGLTCEYKAARRHRLTPVEALEEWDLLRKEEYQLFD